MKRSELEARIKARAAAVRDIDGDIADLLVKRAGHIKAVIEMGAQLRLTPAQSVRAMPTMAATVQRMRMRVLNGEFAASIPDKMHAFAEDIAAVMSVVAASAETMVRRFGA